MKCSIKVNDKLAGYGTMTLYNWYLTRVEEYIEGEQYDIVFSIYDSCENVNAKHKVLMCADQNLKTYNSYTKTLSKYKDNFTEILMVRYIPEVYEQIKKDFECDRILCGNFILFDFDDRFYNTRRNDRILHLGRLCKFKNSIDLIENPAKHISIYDIDCYGNNLLDESGLTEKGLKYKQFIEKSKFINVVQRFNGFINLRLPYKNEDVYDFSKYYKYAISFYDEKFLDNVEYAMLEMINAGCFIILNEDYVEKFNETSILGKITDEMCIIRKKGQTIGSAINQSKLKSVKDYKEKWKEFYNSDKILNHIYDFILH